MSASHVNHDGIQDSIAQFARQVLNEIIGITEDAVQNRSSLDDDLAMESIHLVEFQVALEEKFNVELDPVLMLELNEFHRIVDYVRRQLEGRHLNSSQVPSVG